MMRYSLQAEDFASKAQKERFSDILAAENLAHLATQVQSHGILFHQLI